jgi:hypothetical protein
MCPLSPGHDVMSPSAEPGAAPRPRFSPTPVAPQCVPTGVCPVPPVTPATGPESAAGVVADCLEAMESSRLTGAPTLLGAESAASASQTCQLARAVLQRAGQRPPPADGVAESESA